MREEQQTLWDLYVGIGVLGILAAVLGAWIVEDKLDFVLGVVYGMVVAVGLVTHMYYGLQKLALYNCWKMNTYLMTQLLKQQL